MNLIPVSHVVVRLVRVVVAVEFGGLAFDVDVLETVLGARNLLAQLLQALVVRINFGRLFEPIPEMKRNVL